MNINEFLDKKKTLQARMDKVSDAVTAIEFGESNYESTRIDFSTNPRNKLYPKIKLEYLLQALKQEQKDLEEEFAPYKKFGEALEMMTENFKPE